FFSPSSSTPPCARHYIRKICTNPVSWNGISARQRLALLVTAPDHCLARLTCIENWHHNRRGVDHETPLCIGNTYRSIHRYDPSSSGSAGSGNGPSDRPQDPFLSLRTEQGQQSVLGKAGAAGSCRPDGTAGKDTRYPLGHYYFGKDGV